jgi:hypothetical protein
MNQIDLLSYVPSAEEQAEPSLDNKIRISRHERLLKNRCAIEWWEAKHRYYRWLIQRYIDLGIWDKENGEADPVIQEMRRHQIERLKRLKREAERQVEDLTGE